MIARLTPERGPHQSSLVMMSLCWLGLCFLPLSSSNPVVSRVPSDRVALLFLPRLFSLMGLVTKAIGICFSIFSFHGMQFCVLPAHTRLHEPEVGIFCGSLGFFPFSGSITMASDTLTVVRIFSRLQDADFSLECIHKLNNWDCWNLGCSVAKSCPDGVHVIKVKAHCTAKSSGSISHLWT